MQLHFTKDVLPDSVSTDFQNLNKLNEQVHALKDGLARAGRHAELTELDHIITEQLSVPERDELGAQTHVM